MFDSEALAVVVGLTFIYLLYSLLATILQEIIATHFGFRAKVLERSIFRMLNNRPQFPIRFWGILNLFFKFGKNINIHPVRTSPKAWWEVWKPQSEYRPSNVFELFYQHPLISLLGEDTHYSKPSYLNKETFSKIIIDLLRGNDIRPGDDARPLIQQSLDEKSVKWMDASLPIDPKIAYFLNSIWVDSQSDLDKFRALLENWFDETMDRASGWYKRYTQSILLLVGLIIAITFNVNTFEIVDKLEKDPKLREQVIQQADNFLKTHSDLKGELAEAKAKHQITTARDTLKRAELDSLAQARYDSLSTQLDTLQAQAAALLQGDIKKVRNILGLGSLSEAWNSCCGKKCPAYQLDQHIKKESKVKIRHLWQDYYCRLKLILGWFLTALAISLGAPFWFDLLNKVMKLRGAIATSSEGKNSTPEQTQKFKIERQG